MATIFDVVSVFTASSLGLAGTDDVGFTAVVVVTRLVISVCRLPDCNDDRAAIVGS